MNVEANTNANSSGLEQKWKILISVMFGIFMIILDSTVVNIAFPTLRREFGATLADAQWVLSIYVLSLGVTTPVSGFLADRFGIKRVYLLGLSLFVFGSLLCGFAPSLGWLIAARALQGFGGGIAQPLGPAQLYRAFPPKEQGTALGYFGIALVFAPALGPILGGWLVDLNLWRYIFFINVPIGIVGVFLGSRFLLDYRVERKPSFDPLGLITAVIGFGAVLYAASIAETNGWTGSTTLMFLGIGVAALIAHTIVELYVAKDPMTTLPLFKNPIFLNAAFVGYVATIALFGAEFLMPIYLQAFRGRTALQAGGILLGVALTSGITTPLAGRLYDKIGPRMNLVVGFLLLCINTWQLAKIQGDTPISYIFFLLALRGLAVGLTLQTSFVAALSSIPLDKLPRGSSLLNSTRFVVQAVAVATLATIFSSSIPAEIRAQQDQFQEQQTDSSVSFGVCETPGVNAEDNLPPGAAATLASLPGPSADAAKTKILSTLQAACDSSMRGFENAYQLTFYASIVALIIGAFLPGWPGKWSGRGSMQATPSGGH
ncbi:MAG TPA: DHA2 family efflux MFS transporter permease subunit [Anaerolineales bacterium]|nr:DHA2 family efflux MFS transporter permease subunit [Anaerolineales bacterium]HNC07918.1 DHA2 family efflux MFS transporter permease subunit [Anaerolineales bacterium]